MHHVYRTVVWQEVTGRLLTVGKEVFQIKRVYNYKIGVE